MITATHCGPEEPFAGGLPPQDTTRPPLTPMV
jgi:hypothetical protein